MSIDRLDSITLHRRAATKLMGLSESERLAVEKTLLDLERLPIDKLPLVKLKAPSYPRLFSIRSGLSLRLLFVKKGNAINILDIVHPSELPIAA
ncbi:MAG: hypothetical protein LV480_06495 [Methylacidiphilales bacterium]|nr:hypothetical protein [Candidatus Methylacidiphilales bacterium]